MCLLRCFQVIERFEVNHQPYSKRDIISFLPTESKLEEIENYSSMKDLRRIITLILKET